MERGLSATLGVWVLSVRGVVCTRLLLSSGLLVVLTVGWVGRGTGFPCRALTLKAQIVLKVRDSRNFSVSRFCLSGQ
eukprot:1826420-Amphidinium_carterae.1